MRRNNPLTVKEAITSLLDYAEKMQSRYVSLFEANHHFLAEDVIADHPVPPFDRSPYDGFAVRSIDTIQATTHSPKILQVIGEVAAGDVFNGSVQEREAVRIMTGAQIPEGCDAVIMQEAVKEIIIEGKTYIHVRRPIEKNRNISFTGEDIPQGTVLMKRGQYITPGVIALLATFGYKNVPVCTKPKVGILVTGSELLDVDKPLEPGKIRNSNGYMIYSQILRAGGDPIYLGQLTDDLDAKFKHIKTYLENVDVLITTGGVSVGKYDYMPKILNKLEANILFNKLKMRPGSVTTAAEVNEKLVFALSGNPSACFVGFELFARPYIRTLAGARKPLMEMAMAELGADFTKANPFDRFVRGRLSVTKGKLVATPIGLDKSSVVSSLAEADALIVFPGGTKGYEKGMPVSVIFLERQNGITLHEFKWGVGLKK